MTGRFILEIRLLRNGIDSLFRQPVVGAADAFDLIDRYLCRSRGMVLPGDVTEEEIAAQLRSYGEYRNNDEPPAQFAIVVKAG